MTYIYIYFWGIYYVCGHHLSSSTIQLVRNHNWRYHVVLHTFNIKDVINNANNCTSGETTTVDSSTFRTEIFQQPPRKNEKVRY